MTTLTLTPKRDKEIKDGTRPKDLFPPEQAHALEKGARAVAGLVVLHMALGGFAALWCGLSSLGLGVVFVSPWRPWGVFRGRGGMMMEPK